MTARTAIAEVFSISARSAYVKRERRKSAEFMPYHSPILSMPKRKLPETILRSAT
jgi:hypothetical protein